MREGKTQKEGERGEVEREAKLDKKEVGARRRQSLVKHSEEWVDERGRVGGGTEYAC